MIFHFNSFNITNSKIVTILILILIYLFPHFILGFIILAMYIFEDIFQFFHLNL